ncbi:MAG: glycosyl transferase group 1 [Acidobacteria bacterium]|nr:glycosyl transferase group 1 [Acidobacteriota bacterium]
MSKYLSNFRLAGQNLTSTIIQKPLKDSALACKPRILMVGMHLTKTRGGISTLISEILNSSLKDEFEFVYIESQAEDFGGVGKALLAVRAVLLFIFNCILKRPHLIYVHLGSNASLYRESFFIFLAKLLRKPVIAHFHAGDINEYYPFQSSAGRGYIRRAIAFSDKIIAVSEESARQLRNVVGNLNISVIPNAIDTSVFKFNRKTVNECESPGFLRLLFVGAVGKLKGEKDLIKALSILRERKFFIKVSFLGYGAENLKSYCEKLNVAEFIEFAGAVSMSERIDFFRKADIFVLPTYAEAMPMSVIEAMAAGLPVISTKVGGIPELIEHGKDGLLYAAGDVNALADNISLLLGDETARINLGRNARKKASEQMDFHPYAQKLHFQISELLTVNNIKNI